MSNNVEVKKLSANSGAYEAGTVMATVQNVDGSHSTRVVVDSSALPDGVATSANQTNGTQLARIVDVHGHQVNVQKVTDVMDGDEYGAVVNATIHGLDPHGDWKAAKVSHDGNIDVEIGAVGAGVVMPTRQVDDDGNSIIVTGSNTGAKGIRVFGGPTDPISDIPIYLDLPHHQIHEKESWYYANLQTGGINSGSNFDIRISVPTLAATTRTPHMTFEIIANGECEAYLHSGVTWTSGGTAAGASANTTAIDNRNHNFTTETASTAIYVNGATALTVNSTGTIRYIWYMPSAGVRTNTSDRSRDEIDLKSNTEYMLRITSRATGLKFLARIDFYEDKGV